MNLYCSHEFLEGWILTKWKKKKWRVGEPDVLSLWKSLAPASVVGRLSSVLRPEEVCRF